MPLLCIHSSASTVGFIIYLHTVHGPRYTQSKDASLKNQTLYPSSNKDRVGESYHRRRPAELNHPCTHFYCSILVPVLTAIPSIFLYRSSQYCSLFYHEAGVRRFLQTKCSKQHNEQPTLTTKVRKNSSITSKDEKFVILTNVGV